MIAVQMGMPGRLLFWIPKHFNKYDAGSSTGSLAVTASGEFSRKSQLKFAFCRIRSLLVAALSLFLEAPGVILSAAVLTACEGLYTDLLQLQAGSIGSFLCGNFGVIVLTRCVSFPSRATRFAISR